MTRRTPRPFALHPAIAALAIVLALAGCGGKEIATQPSTSVITNKTDLCDAKLNACTNLAARGIDACSNRAQLAANQECIGESVKCFNDVSAAYGVCAESEDLCRVQGSPEIRVCTRACRVTYTTSESVCTSSQNLALEDCRRKLNAADDACLDQGKRVFDTCISPARNNQTHCNSDVQIAYTMCLSALDGRAKSCREECNNQACLDGCAQTSNTMRIHCDTEQQLGLNACNDAFNVAATACNAEERTIRDTCEGAIPAETRMCGDNVFLSAQLCHQKAGEKQEDCARGCDPLGDQRCNMHCMDHTNAAYGECIKGDFTCFISRSNEGGVVCESQGDVKIEKCFTEAEVCKKAEH